MTHFGPAHPMQPRPEKPQGFGASVAQSLGMVEGCETDFGFVPYSPRTLAYLERVAPRRNEPLKRGRISRERIAHMKAAERVAFACCTCAAIEFAHSGNVLEAF